MIHRRLLPLALMYVNEDKPIEGRTRLQKMVFLMQKELEERSSAPTLDYEFIPYDYGPFSKDLYDDLDIMISQQFVDYIEEPLNSGNVKYVYELENNGKDLIESEPIDGEALSEILQVAREIRARYGEMLLSKLIEFVYSEYPEYAERSVY